MAKEGDLLDSFWAAEEEVELVMAVSPLMIHLVKEEAIGVPAEVMAFLNHPEFPAILLVAKYRLNRHH